MGYKGYPGLGGLNGLIEAVNAVDLGKIPVPEISYPVPENILPNDMSDQAKRLYAVMMEKWDQCTSIREEIKRLWHLYSGSPEKYKNLLKRTVRDFLRAERDHQMLYNLLRSQLFLEFGDQLPDQSNNLILSGGGWKVNSEKLSDRELDETLKRLGIGFRWN